jgi:hypothetical protein
MKFIQITHKYNPFIDYFEKKYNIVELNPDFRTLQRLLVHDGFYAPHILKPVFDDDENSFYIMWDYNRLQLTWAKENNYETNDLIEILGLQIKLFDPEVIYNMSAQMISFDFLKSFGKKLLCWNADAYSLDNDVLLKYDALLTSSVNKLDQGRNVFLHYPSCDPLMDEVADHRKKIDIFFYGQYNGHVFELRRKYIEALIPFFKKKKISFEFALLYYETERIKINIPYLRRFKFAKEKVPTKKIAENFSPVLFGKDIYNKIAQSKIIFNISGGQEQFGDYRFNMRIFETLGVGGFMLSDEGKYPPHLDPEKHFATYASIDDLKQKILKYLNDDNKREEIGARGLRAVKENYSKEKQWENFQNIIRLLDV